MLPQEATEFCNQQTSKNTKEAYHFDLLTWFRWLHTREPSKSLAIEYRQYLEDNYSPRTAARRFNTARSFYGWAGGDNVFASIRSPRRLRNSTPPVPLDATVESILEHAGSARDRAIIALLLNGLRASEVCALTPNDFVWSPEYGCHIIRVTGKGFKERLVPANSETSREVSAYLGTVKRGSANLVAPLRGSGMMTRRQVTEVMRRACKRAGIPDVNPHKLRHYYATHLVRSDVSPFALQKLMGHESLTTTMVYVTMDLRDLVKEAKKGERNVDGNADSVLSGDSGWRGLPSGGPLEGPSKPPDEARRH